MIEFAILFGLGFLTAILLVSLLAPAIHRRVVAYTEKRLFSTMPISPQEVRAQKDMARAVYAAENARTRQALEEERQKALTLTLQSETAAEDAGRLFSEARELRRKIDAMTAETRDLRAKARRHEDGELRLKARLDEAEETARQRAEEIARLTKRVTAILREIDDAKIALSARDLEIEQARQQGASWRREREAINRELESTASKNRDASTQISRDSRKVLRLEEQIVREAARNSENEALLERRAREIDRLKERLRAETGEAGATVIRLPNPANAEPPAPAAQEPEPFLPENENTTGPDAPLAQPAGDTQTSGMQPPDLARAGEEIRNRGLALTERLINSTGKGTDGGNDAALRREMADIAARLIALTAAREGEASLIPALLAAEAKPENGRRSLAAQARDLIAAQSAPQNG